METWAASSVPPLTDLNALSLRTRSACALVYSVFNCSRRAERMLVFCSGLMTLSSRSNCASAALDRSILIFSSSSCLSMNAERLAEDLKRIL